LCASSVVVKQELPTPEITPFLATTEETDSSPAPFAATAFLASQLSACSQAIQEPQASDLLTERQPCSGVQGRVRPKSTSRKQVWHGCKFCECFARRRVIANKCSPCLSGEKQCTARELEPKHCWGGGHFEANHYLLKRPSPCDGASYSFGQSKCAHKQGRHL
ncbi:hypothetical protein V5799_006300, partial [Amblyomma americanum]